MEQHPIQNPKLRAVVQLLCFYTQEQLKHVETSLTKGATFLVANRWASLWVSQLRWARRKLRFVRSLTPMDPAASKRKYDWGMMTRGLPGLVNVYVTMERSTIFNGKINYFYGILWPCSIAMFNYQRVSTFSDSGHGSIVHYIPYHVWHWMLLSVVHIFVSSRAGSIVMIHLCFFGSLDFPC